MEGLGYQQAAINTYLPILLALPLRVLAFRKHIGRIPQTAPESATTLRNLPWREFTADLVLWTLIGLTLVFIYTIHFRAPYSTGAKVFLGSLAFGALGGMLSFLSAERHIMDFLKDTDGYMSVSPKKMLSVSRKMLFFTIAILFLMAVMVLLMVYTDITYLLVHKELLGPQIFTGVFKEIVFAFGVLLFLSILIMTRYSRNIGAILDLQLGVMEDISRGQYDKQVPVVSNDEFGLIAAKTNDMVRGLKERDFCQISFGRYVTPEVSQKILNGEVVLEGEMRDVTILFCDLRGYTSFVEKRDPKEVVRFLNAYFTEMELAVKKHKGIILQYIGDEIEAVFGAPMDLPDHPDMAVRTALEMRLRLTNLNENRKGQGEKPVAHGIGIHSGPVLAGSVGSPERLVYAMVGDTVNAASRIQTLNKRFGTDILISHDTKKRLKGNGFRLASMGRSALKGKSQEIEIYKVI